MEQLTLCSHAPCTWNTSNKAICRCSRNRAKWVHPYVRPHVNNEERKECLTEGYPEHEKLSITHMHMT